MDEHCPDCGASVKNAREGCQALYDELWLQSSENPIRASVQTLAFDTYCMQHLERYCVSGKSYAAHLTRLCCGIEHGGKPQIYAAIQRWLNTAKPQKPSVLSFLGDLTVADMLQAKSDADYVQLVRAWAEDVWKAYESQQELARAWLQEALER